MASGSYQPAKQRDSVDHVEAIQFVFENPNWIMNLVWVGLCMLVPLVGPLVLHGYQFAIIESLHLRPESKYPDFDFDKLGEYLLTGAWVFLATLVIGLIFGLFAGALAAIMVVGLAIAGAAGGEDGAGVAMMIIMPPAIIVGVVVYFGTLMMMVPLILRVGLTRSINEVLNFKFAWQFVKNTWAQILISGVIFVVAVAALELIGLLMFCVGVIFTVGLGMLMQAHLGMQLYEVHLARGGDAIPMEPQGK